MNRTEMIRAVERLFVAEGTEEEIHNLVRKLKQTTPHAGISDLIYYPDQDRTPEEIVDEALRREQEHSKTTPGVATG